MYGDPILVMANLSSYTSPAPREGSSERYIYARAAQLYTQKCQLSLLARLRRLIQGSMERLPSLAAVGQPAGFRGGHYVGTQTVPIRRIRGSEDRGGDYDRQFRPWRGTSRARWISVAAARLKGAYLPPVELIQVGDTYYVRDGHNRVSVALALGEEFIDASVTKWEATAA